MKKIYFLVLALGLFTSVNAQIITFPDANLKAKILQSSTSNSIAENLSGSNFKVDANNDGEIQVTEALQVKDLDIYNSSVVSLFGIQGFTNMTALHCGSNQITTLNLTGMPNLVFLDCGVNRLTTLDISGLSGLKSLWCQGNTMTTLNLGALPGLETVYCDTNWLTSLNLSGLIGLKFLKCSSNRLISLNASPAINLQTLYCDSNRLTSINVNGLSKLSLFHCYSNNLTTIDATSLKSLTSFWCYINRLTSLFIKNGKNESLSFYGNPNLSYICVDESQLVEIQQILASPSYLSMHTEINTYCSFTPGGTFYSVQGNTKFDATANGCDVNDVSFPNLKFSISNGTLNGNLVSDPSGNYYLPLEAGTYSITPILENPTYFNVSPTVANVTFPTQASPFTQNFCIAKNGVHNDLEVMIYPTTSLRPGFDAAYTIYYKNKGSNTQSGNINLIFNDAVFDLIAADPVPSNQLPSNLSWTFTDLLPLEARIIRLGLNLNSPTEVPAVNAGDVFNFRTSISSMATDEMPNDNTFTLNQTVVNSFDPNDKTCLEGSKITPTQVGDYVHYMIRFENTGTANAQNIVVKDMIDTAKFDVSSLIPMKGSHSFVTNISSGNKVEFIFENINLPFDDANNDGYIAFKIKTKPTLVLGNTFSNTASIYFDYNFPIVTNTATTTIATLSNQDFEFSNYFNLYPNPVHEVLNITTKATIAVSSVSIYNIVGQLVLVIPNAQDIKTINVSSLTSGNYFIKINSDKGTSNTKFIKN